MEYYADNDAVRTTTIDIAPNAVITINGTNVNYSQLDTVIYTNYNANLRFLETTGDKYFDAVAVTVYEYGIVEEVIPDGERVIFNDGNRLLLDTTDPEQIADIYDADGNRIGLSDIQPGDVLAMIVGDLDYESYLPVAVKTFSERITIYNLGDKSVTGMLTGCSASDRIFVIDGVYYDCAPVFVGLYGFDDFINSLGLGATAKFYLDMKGKIIGCDDTGFDNRG
ncbi:MAG: hypothetical protein IJ365_03515, partial [Clostridia bacterium]|nr:hypothetical protein [Clostridia bacterium]